MKKETLPESAHFARFEWLVLCAIGFLTLAPLWHVQLTNTDDMVYSQLGSTHDWDSPYTNAVGMGRFYYLYSGYLYMTPYIIPSFWYFKLCALGPLAAIPYLLGCVLRRATRCSSAMPLTVLLYFVGLQFYTDYYPTAAFPFVFTFSIVVFLLSLIGWLSYLENGRRVTYWLSLGLFVLGILPYETFVVLFTAVTALITIGLRQGRGWPSLRCCYDAMHQMRGHLLALLLYAMFYIGFTFIPVPEGFSRDHYQIAETGFNLALFGKTMVFMSGTSLPTASFFYGNTHYLTQLVWDSPSHFSSALDVVRVARVDWWVRAFLSAGLTAALISRRSVRPADSQYSLLALLLVGLVVMLLSPILHALTTKYQEQVARGVFVYLPTFFAFLGFVTVSTAALLFVQQRLPSSRWLAFLTITGCATTVGAISLVHSFNNYHVARYQSHQALTWTVLEQALETHPFQQLPDEATLYAPDLPIASVTYDMLSGDTRDYWSDFISERTGKAIHVTYALQSPGNPAKTPDYYLGLRKMPRDFTAFLVLSPLSQGADSAELVAEDFDLFTYSKYKEFLLTFRHNHAHSHPVFIEGQESIDADSDQFQAAVVRPVATALVSTHVSGREVLLRSISLSFFRTGN